MAADVNEALIISNGSLFSQKKKSQIDLFSALEVKIYGDWL